MANITLRIDLRSGIVSGPLYNAYYSTDNGNTYIIATGGAGLQLPTVNSAAIIQVPDNVTNVKLVTLSEGCQSNSTTIGIVTTTTTTTNSPLTGSGTYTCATRGSSNGTFTIYSLSGGIGPPYQTTFFSEQLDQSPVWNDYPQVSSYGNLFAGSSPTVYTFGIRTSNGFTVFLDSTLCTTTTQTPSNVSITTLNNLDPNSFTIYVNDVADTGWKSGTRTLPAGSVVKIIYNSNACGVTLNGSSYTSNASITLGGGTAQNFSLNNYNYWVGTGYFPCYDNVAYQQEVNPCGQYQTVKRYPNTTCDCECNQTCNGASYSSNTECRGQDLVRYEYWNCSGNATGNYQVVESCSCSCNYSECGETYYTPNYCGNPNRIGKNPSSLYRDKYYSCGPYITTETIDDCSCSCNQTCDGEYWGDPYCDGTGIQKRNKKYTCNGANTGEVQTLSTCSAECGAFVAPIWSPFTAPYCEGCTQYQDEVQTNTCCVDPPSGTERTVPLGTSSECGTWNIEYYCKEGTYDQWSRLRNSCTNTTCCDQLYEANAYVCGYRPCSTWDIIAYNSDEYIYVNYQNCADFPDFASFYSGSGGIVGSLCVRNGTTPYISSGNGAANNTYVMCS
jgi:hypothetical protein